MKIIEMRPELTEFKSGQHKKASSWTFIDSVFSDDMGIQVNRRRIRHYDTVMMEFHGYEMMGEVGQDNYTRWTARVVSLGHGSVTDQQGLNQLCGVRYYRNNLGEGTMLKSFNYHMLRDKKGGGPRVYYTGHPAGEHVVLP